VAADAQGVFCSATPAYPWAGEKRRKERFVSLRREGKFSLTCGCIAIFLVGREERRECFAFLEKKKKGKAMGAFRRSERKKARGAFLFKERRKKTVILPAPPAGGGEADFSLTRRERRGGGKLSWGVPLAQRGGRGKNGTFFHPRWGGKGEKKGEETQQIVAGEEPPGNFSFPPKEGRRGAPPLRERKERVAAPHLESAGRKKRGLIFLFPGGERTLSSLFHHQKIRPKKKEGGKMDTTFSSACDEREKER